MQQPIPQEPTMERERHQILDVLRGLARHGRRLFVRRMLLLVGIGFLHLMFIWRSGMEIVKQINTSGIFPNI